MITTLLLALGVFIVFLLATSIRPLIFKRVNIFQLKKSYNRLHIYEHALLEEKKHVVSIIDEDDPIVSKMLHLIGDSGEKI